MKKRAAILLVLVSLFGVTESRAMRWYSSSTGRWFSRDPIEEQGGLNLYLFIGNNAVNTVEPIGLTPYEIDSHLLDPVSPTCFNEGWFRHCVSSCKLNRVLTPLNPLLAPILTQVAAWTKGGDWPGQSGADPGDRSANYRGTFDSYNVLRSCTAQCTDQFYAKLQNECCPTLWHLKKSNPNCCNGRSWPLFSRVLLP
jgi:hypothetical protein